MATLPWAVEVVSYLWAGCLGPGDVFYAVIPLVY